MKFASGASHGLAYVPETTPGATPANPTMTKLRHTSCALTLTRDTLASNELRDDRMASDIRTGVNKVSGDIGFELSCGEYDPFFEAALCGTWSNNVVRVGRLERAFSLERQLENIGVYGVFSGCYLNTLSMSVKPNTLVTGTIGFTGSGGVTYAEAPLAASPVASQTERTFDSYTGTLTSDAGLNMAVVTGLDFSLTNNIEPLHPILSKEALGVNMKKIDITGTLTAYFVDKALLDLFIKETPSKLSMTLGDPALGAYTFRFPRVIYTGGDNPASDDGPISINMPFTAVLDPATGTSFEIERHPAPSTPPATPDPISESDPDTY